MSTSSALCTKCFSGHRGHLMRAGTDFYRANTTNRQKPSIFAAKPPFMKHNGRMFIFTAPSGAGKTTIVRHLLKTFDRLAFSVSATSRPPRPGEVDGKDYYFLSSDEFRERAAAGEFLEWEEVYNGAFYGTLRSEVDRIWALGKHVLFDIEVKGATNLKNAYPERTLATFIKPPSIEVLEQRLRDRGTESEESINKRIARWREELAYVNNFDRVLINDTLPEALRDAEQLIHEFLQTPIDPEPAKKSLRAMLQTMPQTGIIDWIGIRPARRKTIELREEIELTTEGGIVGDHYRGTNGKRQVTLLQREHLAVLSSVLDKPVSPEMLRRNLLVSGINVLALREARFQIGEEVILEGTGACHPCSRMEENLGPGGYNAVRGHGGITARVLRGGTLRRGDTVRFLELNEK